MPRYDDETLDMRAAKAVYLFNGVSDALRNSKIIKDIEPLTFSEGDENNHTLHALYQPIKGDSFYFHLWADPTKGGLDEIGIGGDLLSAKKLEEFGKGGETINNTYYRAVIKNIKGLKKLFFVKFGDAKPLEDLLASELPKYNNLKA